MNFQSNSSWGNYTINWGDATTNTVGTSYTANSILTHSYASTTNSYNLVLTIPSLNCTLTSLVVNERPVNASIQIPSLGITQACAPKTLTFTNASTDVSSTTTFTWDFGDNTPQVIFTNTNVTQNVLHNYTVGTNCQSQITLRALNYCSYGNPTIANFGPIQIYDKDIAAITIDKSLRCFPDNVFTFNNTTTRNCLAQGNTFQRRERWNFGNYWGLGHDSLYPWAPWPPTFPKVLSFPATAGIVNTYTAQLVDSNLCGQHANVITFFIVPSPTAGIITPTGFLCQNVPLTFTNNSSSGFSYLIKYGDGGGFTAFTGSTVSKTYTAPGTYSVQLVAQIPGYVGGCSDTVKTTVQILASPVAGFSVSPNIGCNSVNNATFTNLSSSATSYTWTFANGFSSTLQIPPTQNYTLAGTFAASLAVTASTGCKNQQTQTITVRPLPIPSFPQFTSCVSIATSFTNNSSISGSNPIVSYTWNFGNGAALSNSVNPIVTYTAPGTYTVKLKAASIFCIDSISKSILINVKPTANFVITPTLGCPPFPVNFTNTSINANNYLWRFGTNPASSSTVTNPNVTYTNNTQSFSNFTITLIASTGAGCADSIKKNISVRPRPIANFTSNTITGCSPLITTFSNTSIGGTSFQYNFGNNIFSTNANPVYTYSNSTLFTQTLSAQLVVTNSVGCSDTTRKIITIYPSALIGFSMQPPSGCTPLNVTFPSIPGVATYSWTHGDGSPTFTTLSSHSWSYTNSGNTVLTLTVSLTALTSNGCLGSDSKTIAIFPSPVANFTTNVSAGCAPLNITFSNTSVQNFTNTWQLGNGANSNLINPSTTYTNGNGSAALTYSVKLNIRSANNCRDSISKTISVYSQPLAKFIGDTSGCTPKVVTFTNSSIGANTYVWNFGTGLISNLTSPVNQFTTQSPFTKTYNIKLTSISSNNCKDSTFGSLVVHPKPDFNIMAAPDSGCSPLRVFFPKIVGVKTYQWFYNNINFGSTGDFFNSFENNGGNAKSFFVELIGKDNYGCIDTASKNIKVFPQPTAKFEANPLTVFLPNQATQFTNLSSSAASYSWNFGDNNSSTLFSPSHTYSLAGSYAISLIVTSNRGCRDTFELPQKVMAVDESTITMPNAFTPNLNGSPGNTYDPKDKSNDIFYPNIKGAEKYSFSVYSRWGELLFDTKNPDEGWDGYYKGKLCTQDVYIWKLNVTFIDGKTYNKTGDLMLLR
jgi:PKD repeat protein